MAEAIRSAALGDLPHGFLTRAIDAGDDAAIADAVLQGAAVVRVKQVHSPAVATVREPWGRDARPEADALVTDRRGLLLAIVTADCAPVLLADRDAGVIGAAHAGWRGALGGVIEATLAGMEALGAQPSRTVAAIGPCIAQPNYEVDEAFRARFAAADARFFASGREGRWQFDLEGYAAQRLERAGVGAIDRLGLDTYADPERFCSYRRATHRGNAGDGRQVSLIGLAAAA